MTTCACSSLGALQPKIRRDGLFVKLKVRLRVLNTQLQREESRVGIYSRVVKLHTAASE
jgi:hypothetical protein